MKLEISQEAATALIDSIELAIHVVTDELSLEFHMETSTFTASQLRTAIADLQMMRVSYLIAARNPNKKTSAQQTDRVYDKLKLWTKDQHDAQS